MVIAEAASPEELEQILSANAISAIVADARDHALVSAVGREHAIPILLVASSLLDGLIAATHAGNAGIVVTSDNLAPTLAAALNAVISGQPYRSPVLQTPFAGFDLTPREQRLLVLEAQNCPIQAMAKHLGVAVTTVSQYRQRLRIKLGLDQADELAEWARTYLQTRARTGGD
jgi:DNA-binding NarL/FixJ family response regulator